jgi:hypothetical protein
METTDEQSTHEYERREDMGQHRVQITLTIEQVQIARSSWTPLACMLSAASTFYGRANSLNTRSNWSSDSGVGICVAARTITECGVPRSP